MVSPAKAGSWAYLFELFRYVLRDVKIRPSGYMPHLPPHKRGKYLPALVPEKCPDQPEGGDNLIGIGPLPLAVRRTLFFRLEFYCPAVRREQDFPDRLSA